MPLVGNRWGTAVHTAIQGFGVDPTEVHLTLPQVEQIWQAICGAHKGEINTNADMRFLQADIRSQVDPTKLRDDTEDGNPVRDESELVGLGEDDLGEADNKATLLTGQIE